jgi:hypothetical protein
MHLDLTDEEAAALLRELDGLINGDRYFLSPRIKMLRAIRPSSDQSRSASPCRHLRSAMNHRERPHGSDGERDAEQSEDFRLKACSYSSAFISTASPHRASRMRNRVRVSQ